MGSFEVFLDETLFHVYEYTPYTSISYHSAFHAGTVHCFVFGFGRRETSTAVRSFLSSEQFPQFLRSMFGETNFMGLAENFVSQLREQQGGSPLGVPAELEQVLQSFAARIQQQHHGGGEDPAGGSFMPDLSQLAELLATHHAGQQARQFSAGGPSDSLADGGAGSPSDPGYSGGKGWHSSLSDSIESLRELAARLSNVTLSAKSGVEGDKVERRKETGQGAADRPFGLPVEAFPGAGGLPNGPLSANQVGAALLEAMTGRKPPTLGPSNSTDTSAIKDKYKAILTEELAKAAESMQRYMGFDVVSQQMLGALFGGAAPGGGASAEGSTGAGVGRSESPADLFASLLGARKAGESNPQPSKHSRERQKKVQQQSQKEVPKRQKPTEAKGAMPQHTKPSEETA